MSLKTFAARMKFHSPKILVFTGLGLLLGGTVAACIATTKLDDIVDEARGRLDIVNNKAKSEEISIEEARKLKTSTYFRAASKTAKVFIPAAVLSATGCASVLKGFQILSTRNAELVATCSALTALHNRYRKNVVKKYGKDVDYALAHDIDISPEQEEFAEKTDKTIKDEKDVPWYGILERCFDESNPNWSKDKYFNQVFLSSMQNRVNDIMMSRRKERLHKNGVLEVRPGFITALELYQELGWPASELTGEDAIVGKMTDGACDPSAFDYIDFGVFKSNDRGALEFVDGVERSVWIRPNFDGVIYDKIGKSIYFKNGVRCDKRGNPLK